MEYAVDKTPENRIIFILEEDGMRVERESDGKTMFYDYRNIAKINHKVCGKCTRACGIRTLVVLVYARVSIGEQKRLLPTWNALLMA